MVKYQSRLLGHWRKQQTTKDSYRKPTHTYRLLDQSSYNPTSHKATTIRTLTRRAQLVCDSPESLQDETQNLNNVFSKNDYNTDFVRRNTHTEQYTRSNAATARPLTLVNLSTRLTERKRATRNGDVNNHIPKHHLKTKHQIDWDSATCITYYTDYQESWFINLKQMPMNRSQ